jgi:ParB family chromosome partitioning protein
MTKRGLGKGLAALITDHSVDELAYSGIQEIEIQKIEPNRKQPRKLFNEKTLQELAESIKQYGIVQPLLVKKMDGYYEIVAGERRWRAARIAGIKKVPVVIKEYSPQEALEISLIENIQREDLNPIEEAESYKRLTEDFGLSQEEVATKVGKNRSTVTNSMRLLQLDERVQGMIIEERVSSGHGRALLSIGDHQKQYELAEKIIQNNISVRETERLVKAAQVIKVDTPPPNQRFQAEYKHIEEQFKNILGTKVQLSQGRKKGKIEIEYYSDDDLDRILQLMKSIQ